MTSSAQDRCYRWRSRFGDRFADYRISPLQHGQCECGTTPTFSTFNRAVETPATLEIVPSPVIDTNSEFFFGTGDGSIGYYAERPNR
jgi:hypothetical protein